LHPRLHISALKHSEDDIELEKKIPKVAFSYSVKFILQVSRPIIYQFYARNLQTDAAFSLSGSRTVCKKNHTRMYPLLKVQDQFKHGSRMKNPKNRSYSMTWLTMWAMCQSHNFFSVITYNYKLFMLLIWSMCLNPFISIYFFHSSLFVKFIKYVFYHYHGYICNE